MDLEKYLIEKKAKIDCALSECLKKTPNVPPLLEEGLNYALFPGGKRLRPIITLASAELTHQKHRAALWVACGVELIHTYSLVHDDLPCIDNDDYRRGKLTCHRRYSEGVAVLIGDALLTRAFEIISERVSPASLSVRITRELASAVNAQGLIGGQIVDLINKGKKLSLKEIEYIHFNKSTRLFIASARAGGLLATLSKERLQAIGEYGQYFGSAFQLLDDLCDAQKDALRGIPNITQFYSENEIRKKASYFVKKAIQSLAPFKNAQALKELARALLKA